MVKITLFFTLFVSTLSANFYTLKSVKVTDDIHCFIGDYNPPLKSNNGFISNVCFVDIGNSIVLMDTGPSYNFGKELHTFIKKQYPNKNISHAIVTNFHDDRLQGASYFKTIGTKIIGHTSLNKEIKKFKSKFNRMYMKLPKDVMANTKVVEADLLVDDGYEIKGSKKTITIVKPSQVSEEQSDIAIYSKDDSFIFAGNIIFNGRMLNYRKASNIDGWIEAIEKLNTFGAKYILGGHGKQYDKNSYKYSYEYLKALKVGVQNAYEEDLDIEDVKSSFDMKKFENMKHFKQLHNNNVNNYYEQLEFGE
jgi:glyoxylase-like metal-dependent hydrolase (beta-lactamase superfamily II)